MKRKNYIKTWFDGEIDPGREWEDEIFAALSNADIILLLVSPDFIASDYCYNIEMKKAIDRHEKGEAIVIPIILSHCDWKDTPFSKLQSLPKDALPVLDSKWYNEDEALYSVATGIKGIVTKIIEEREKVILDYYTEVGNLKSEIEQLKARVEFLKKNESDLEASPKSKLSSEIAEKNELIHRQEITIYELKSKLSEYTKINVDGKIINLAQKAKIKIVGYIYPTINEPDTHATSWKNQEIRKLAGEKEWKKTGFEPKKGMVGEIVDSFQHKLTNTIVYILKIDDKYYIPIGESGIELIK